MFQELNNEQRRQLIDAQQAYQAYREASHEFLHAYEGAYAGGMQWKRVGEHEYLYRTRRGVAKSLGPRSAETEALKDDYARDRERRRRRLRNMKTRLQTMAPVNRAMGLGRVPEVTARIVRKLDEENLLGRNVTVVGTNALYAYEARAGVRIDSGIVATGDVDLLLDARRKLSLAASGVRAAGLLGLLKKVDASFERQGSRYSAVNSDVFKVDLICPEDKSFLRRSSDSLSGAPDDLQAAGIAGLGWLVNAPKFEEVAISDSGSPIRLAVVDPRVFAIHKVWLSARIDREPAKRRRDAEQALAAATLAVRYFALSFKASELSALPEALCKEGEKLAQRVA